MTSPIFRVNFSKSLCFPKLTVLFKRINNPTCWCDKILTTSSIPLTSMDVEKRLGSFGCRLELRRGGVWWKNMVYFAVSQIHLYIDKKGDLFFQCLICFTILGLWGGILQVWGCSSLQGEYDQLSFISFSSRSTARTPKKLGKKMRYLNQINYLAVLRKWPFHGWWKTRDLLERLVKVTSNDRGWKGHDLNHHQDMDLHGFTMFLRSAPVSGGTNQPILKFGKISI